ncbi:MAG: hypothetical protein HY888_02075, partial [Deltaproteobacteria bacterium]|nr:hypothetical protein [Deltaproteobacteria bacterium]
MPPCTPLEFNQILAFGRDDIIFGSVFPDQFVAPFRVDARDWGVNDSEDRVMIEVDANFPPAARRNNGKIGKYGRVYQMDTFRIDGVTDVVPFIIFKIAFLNVNQPPYYDNLCQGFPSPNASCLMSKTFLTPVTTARDAFSAPGTGVKSVPRLSVSFTL